MIIPLNLFAVIWNQNQKQTTPAVHLKILNWLEDHYTRENKQLLLMAFRSCGKSTLVGLYCAWRIFCDPALRIMVLAADDLLARKMVRNVKRILERHPLTLGMKPEDPDQWASDRFTVKRERELRDPTMLARGITSNFTGSRADIIIYDDVEVPNTSATAEARESLRDLLDESRFILAAGGTQIYVGTPHTFDTIYQIDDAQQKPGQSAAFLKGFEHLKIPILNSEGESAWPEKFPTDAIAQIKYQVGPNKFASQMMLEAVNIADGRLPVEALQFYHSDLEYKEAQQKPVLYLNGKQLISCSSYWDPAFGSARGDGSVWALIFTDESGRYYLHHLEYLKTDLSCGDDEATQQCKKIAALCRQFYVPSVTVEINGIGKFLPAILRREIRASGHPCAIVEQASRIPKSQRILEGFDAVLAAENLSVHHAVRSTFFLSEMREWTPAKANGADDGLDAVAGALLQEPIKIAAGRQKGTRKNWSPSGDIFKAKV